MDELEQIEQKYGFASPEDYRSMQAAGWFDVVASDNPNYKWRPGPHWFELPYDEWMSLSEIFIYEPEEREKPGFVPFASEPDGSH